MSTYHEHTHRVTYAETDQMGFVYYANYFVLFEIGRTELIRASGMAYKALEDMGFLLPVIEASCKYISPAGYDDMLTIRTRVAEFKGIRLRFEYQVTRDGAVLAEGMTMHAFVDKEGRPKKLPKEIREVIERASDK